MEVINKLKVLDDLEDTEYENTLEQIVAFANSSTENFIQQIQKTELADYHYLDNVYCELYENMKKWEGFFMSEITRLLTISKNTEYPEVILKSIMDISCYIEDAADELTNIIRKELDNENAIFRFYALRILQDDLVKRNDFQTMMKLKYLLNDSNWRIRFLAHGILKSIDKLDYQQSLSWKDKIRAKFKDVYKYS